MGPDSIILFDPSIPLMFTLQGVISPMKSDLLSDMLYEQQLYIAMM